MSERIHHDHHPDRRRFIGATASTLAAAAGLGLIGGTPLEAMMSSRLPVEGDMPAFNGATEWINSPALTPSKLHGKVVVVDFCTYTCINWLRSLPYVRAWSETYRDKGLVVIGVHTPEFQFEHQLPNVRRSLKDMRVEYPIAVDNDYAIWRAFDNHYWPALYLVDAKGRIRYHHFGEGEYEQAETNIQQLLTDAGATGIGRELVSASVQGRGIEAPGDWENVRSAENYVGRERTEGFKAPDGVAVGKPRMYSVPPRLSLNQWALAGEWTVSKQAIALNQAGGKIAYRFHARDLHLVMGPPQTGTAVRFRVLIDGQPPAAARGGDVDESGGGVVKEQRLYQLIRQSRPIADRQFEIEFLDPGVEAFSFTFG